MTSGDLWDRRHELLPGYSEDVVAEAFTRLIAADARGGVTEPEGLLRTIAWSLRVGNDRQQERETPVPPEALTHMRAPTIEDVEFQGVLNDELRTLPLGMAQAYILTELRGLTQAEAAVELQVGQPRVSRLVDAARVRLKGALTDV